MSIRRSGRAGGPLLASAMLLAGSVPSTQAPTTVSLAAPADRWNQFRGSPQLTGVSDATLPDALKVLWTYEAGDAIESSAAVVDGVVYVGSVTGELHAVNLSDGTLRWKYKASADWHRRIVAGGRGRHRVRGRSRRRGSRDRRRLRQGPRGPSRRDRRSNRRRSSRPARC